MKWSKKVTQEKPKNKVTVYFVDETKVTFEVYQYTTRYFDNFIQFITTTGKYRVFSSENVKEITWKEVH